MSRPMLSVVMSVYNDEDYLERSVESILMQEGVDLEFIIVNDGSTDSSSDILEKLAQQDSRVHLVHQKNNGLTKALILGCNLARGEFIARQDADDYSAPGRLAALVDFLQKNAAISLAFSWTRCLVPDGLVIDRINPTASPKELTRKLREEMIGIPAHGSVMFRKSAYLKAGGYRKEFYYAQDCDLWLRFAPLGDIGCVPLYLYDLSYGVNSISSRQRNYQKRFAELAQSCFLARKRGESEAEYLAGAAELRHQVISTKDAAITRRNHAITKFLVGATLDSQQKNAALGYYWSAIRTWPFLPQVWKRVLVHLLKRGVRSIHGLKSGL